MAVSVTDGQGNRDVQLFTIGVDNANDRPESVQSVSPPTLTSNAAFTLPDGAFTDADGDALVYTVTLANGEALPEWVSFDSARLELRIGVVPVDTDVLELAVQADDERGGNAQITVRLLFDAPEPVDPGEPAPAIPEPEEASAVLIPNVDVPHLSGAAPVSAAAAKPANAENSADRAAADQSDFSSRIADASEHLAAVVVEHLDLSNLLGPIAPFDADSLAVVSAIVRSDSIDPPNAIRDPVQTLSLTDLFSISQDAAQHAINGLVDLLNTERDEQVEAANFAQTLLGTSLSVTSGLTVGYLLWLIRSGALMGSVLSALPALRLVDPLPVLSSLGQGGEQVTDTESLESLVSQGGTHTSGARKNAT